MTFSDAAYELVPNDLHESVDEEKRTVPRRAGLKDRVSDALPLLAFVVAVFSLLLSLVPYWPQTSQAAVLRRPNAYIGLERVHFPSNASFPPILNYPLTTFQLRVGDKARKLMEDTKSERTVEGTVFPEERHTVLSTTVGTVVQFRAMDWGMERCTLNLSIPEGSNFLDGPSLNVWMLASDIELRPGISAWGVAPARSKLLASSARLGQAHTIDFACLSGSFPTLELTCSENAPPAECSVDFWQDASGLDSARRGIHVIQHWSRT
ncbi:hypothetical protein EXIGLDRAFT_834421 [Exidia glandulosa HHB12029]|uniref:Ubiquitin 3 binding protein But2 C-terminal domain-containing protein n=1 Tax=Exidia glandulosa HHB12029 TaxID=1314781 RepID=A0A165JSF3_EXIGL|nr:hypothetical protein EXIGLDRAFT_834421 [Exidia glandulosa HHB12029]